MRNVFESSQVGGGYKPWVDELRGIAALLVLFSHYYWTPYVHQQGILHDLISPGEFGVALFFCISGFVIPLSVKASRPGAAVKFIVHRIFRLYPIYWLAVAIAAVLLGSSVHDFLINMTMIQRYLGVDDILDVSWTLQVELFFYVLTFGILIFSAGRSVRSLMISFLCTSAIVVLSRAAAYVSPVHLPTGLFDGLFVMLFSWIVFFCPKPLGRKGRALVTGVVIIVQLAWLCETDYPGFAGTFDPSSIGKVVSYDLAILAFWSCFRFRAPVVTQGNAILMFLGRISYSTYLLHMPVYIFLKEGYVGQLNGLALFIAATVVTVILSTVTHRLVERPSIRIGKLVSQYLIDRKTAAINAGE